MCLRQVNWDLWSKLDHPARNGQSVKRYKVLVADEDGIRSLHYDHDWQIGTNKSDRSKVKNPFKPRAKRDGWGGFVFQERETSTVYPGVHVYVNRKDAEADRRGCGRSGARVFKVLCNTNNLIATGKNPGTGIEDSPDGEAYLEVELPLSSIINAMPAKRKGK